MRPPYPVIDPVATGANIKRLRIRCGLTVREVQHWFNFEEPRAIYKWQRGQTLPSVDNLFALSVLLGVRMDEIIVRKVQRTLMREPERSGSVFLHFLTGWAGWNQLFLFLYREIC